MQFQYLGTAAAEGWPAVFCRCKYCLEAQRLGGKNIRTRSQAIVNDDLLLDLPPDTYMHKLMNHLDLSRVKYLFVTHFHMDHFYPQELTVRGSVYSLEMISPELEIYCAQETYDYFRRCADWEIDENSDSAMHWHILKPFETVEAGPYRVTPLPANHMNPSHQPFVYHIVDTREDKSVFYMHDSGYYFPEVWDYLKAQKKPADLFSFDTTLGYEDCGFKSTHMGAPEVIRLKEELEALGIIDKHTHCVMNHFSHNGHLLYDELVELAAPHDIEISYDGMKLTL
ncbi:MBL fold metallo-hydrolase [Hominenteromicrobium sp.]|uniref:MBL fold metallo-hydrolase n=1 Tax=Hominenteromicrobium sp. TaxID=3073581 RepID=UPI003AB8E759